MYEKMIAVTNRQLCGKKCVFAPGTEWYQAYLEQIDWIASLQPRAMVLREKDLPCDAYLSLASEVLSICRAHGTELILHSFTGAAESLNYRKIHLPLEKLRTMKEIETYDLVGTSVHSVADALEAEQLGAGYVFAGNIYETDCKKGLPGRGLCFLKEVCEACHIPVYAIGGITPERLPEVRAAGAAGACMMSGFMKMQIEI